MITNEPKLKKNDQDNLNFFLKKKNNTVQISTN
jgi:hypothetical protein